MQPLTVFDSHFRSAQTLLKVYRLLSSEQTPTEGLMAKLREAIGWQTHEPLSLLLNDLFVGLVRERQADVQPAFFEQANLSLLLRQAVVSACTAMDVYFPALLDSYLSVIVGIRQRNFLPADGDVKQLFQGFSLRLDELPALLEEEDAGRRWSILARRGQDYCREKTLANAQGINAIMALLGVSDAWRQIAGRAGMPETALRSQIQMLTKRRNDIIHRGDRLTGQTESDPQPIDYAWTSAHIGAANVVVLACDALASDSVRRLEAEAAG